MAEEKRVLRLGEWIEANQYKYITVVDCVAMTTMDQQARFDRRTLNVIQAHDVTRMFKDYDKYLDDNFGL